MIIRPMAQPDAAAIVTLARELAAALADPDPALTAEDLLRDGLGPDRWFDCMVAEEAGAIIGFAMACRGFEAHVGKRRLWLSDLYVSSGARKLGVGRALLHAVARHAATLGCDAVYWDLWRLNPIGKAFYESLGATELGEIAVWRLASHSQTDQDPP